MEGLCLKLDSAAETIRPRDNELEKLIFVTEVKEKIGRDEHYRTSNLIQEKAKKDKKPLESKPSASLKALDSLNKLKEGLFLKLDSALETNQTIRTRNSELEKLIFAMKEREEIGSDEGYSASNLVQENDAMIKSLEEMLTSSRLATETSEELLQAFAVHLSNLNGECLILLSEFDELKTLCASCFKLVQQERVAIQMINHELSNRVTELPKFLESTVAQLTEERRLAAERIWNLESEVETLNSEKAEAEVLISKLKDKNLFLVQGYTAFQRGLLLEVSALKTDIKENMERLQVELSKK